MSGLEQFHTRKCQNSSSLTRALEPPNIARVPEQAAPELLRAKCLSLDRSCLVAVPFRARTGNRA
ncbi:hypothetical protein T484DRAFT_1824146 [Baffinella frigidus]|nr:hypothetical protein T484DRAFT_1824146 [Cryptophyta sp. CCMP2293]